VVEIEGGGKGSGNTSSLKAVLLKEMRFLLRSDRLPDLRLVLALWRSEMAAAKKSHKRPLFAAHLLRILRVLTSVQLYARVAAELNVAALMADTEALAGVGLDNEAVEALQLEALLLLTDLVKKAEQHHKEVEEEGGEEVASTVPLVASSSFLLQDSLTEETFRILLANSLDGGDGGAAVRKREASREILRVVMRQSEAGLQEGTDLQLVLDLSPALDSPQLRAQVARAMLRYTAGVRLHFSSVNGSGF